MTSLCQLLHIGAYLVLLLTHMQGMKRALPPHLHHLVICACYGALAAAAVAEKLVESTVEV
jgi:hypothetical protein